MEVDSSTSGNHHRSPTELLGSPVAALHPPSERVVKLFGVRLNHQHDERDRGTMMNMMMMRKAASMGNLSAYGTAYSSFPNAVPSPSTPENSETGEGLGPPDPHGYVSDGLVQNSRCSRERKKGVPWTEDEHRMFLVGLQKLGKGDWRGIARNFVPSRTPTQVASHAQKYFLRQNNLNKRKRRSSLFDMTTSSVSAPHGTPENVASMVVGSHLGKPLSTTTLANFCPEVHKGEPIVHEGQHVSPQSQCMHEEQQMPTRMQCHTSPAGLYATAMIDEKNLLPLALSSSVTSNPNTDIVSSSMPLPSPPSSFSQVPLLCRKDENADFSGNLTLSIGPPSMIEPQAELSLRLEQPNSTRHAALGDNSSTLVANAIKVV